MFQDATTCNCFVSLVSFVVKAMKPIHPAWPLVIAIAVLTEFRTAGAAAIDVDLHERVVATSPVIRLGDVADVISADRRRARQLSTLLLMPSPAPGTQRFLRKREVEDLLAAHGEDLSQLRIEGALQVAITTAAADASEHDTKSDSKSHSQPPMNRHAAILAGYIEGGSQPEPNAAADNELRDELRRIVVSHLEAKTGQAGNWQVSPGAVDRDLAVLDAATAPPTCQGGRAPWTGRQRFVVTVTTAQGAVQLPIYANISRASAPVAVAIQPIARGAVITAADIELQDLESIPAATSRRAPFTSLDQLIGMEARQAIQPGDLILTDKVQSPVMVKRGDLITVVSQGGGIRVRTSARARSDGARDELVQVESLETRQRYDVRVTGFREAAVFAATFPARTEPSDKPIETARR